MFTVTEAQILGWLTPVLWPFLRVLALLSAMPLLGSRMVPMRVRVGLAFAIALAAQAGLAPAPLLPLDAPMVWQLVLQQVLIGIAVGFSVRLVFAAIELAGEIIGLQMGLNFAAFFDPVSASQSTAVTRLYTNMANFLFVTINGHVLVIAAVIHSFDAFPVSAQPFAFLAQVRPELWGAELFRLGLWSALPIVGLLLFINLVMGIITRVAPQMNLFSIGFPLTVTLGLVALTFSLPGMQQPFVFAMEKMLGVWR
ncbi:flagellar biosynthetic protein FliR [Amphibiibacter pelophylacis]|uniref:Flagellar biosynthetic protein FliR n=1 Tax=Amphibiibacter pelophylacis TaxID=1799477 RepID=A0ACC6P2Y4_9BURK